MLRRFVLAPPLIALDAVLVLMAAVATLVGALRFFLACGASPRYVVRRKRWYESTVLGRPMCLRDYAQFAAWHAETATRRWWRVRE
ncbi:MAG: hypothetical protein EXR48_06050 [Dehalococcoidia bacterium]|nr:hypothetical protein [Dehalococcoidia bacterium]